jgi:hypothetical protein
MTSALLTQAELAGLSLALDGDELVIKGPSEAEAVVLALLAEEGMVTLALRVLAEAAAREYQVAIIVGGGIDQENDNALILGDVIHFGEASWRAFVDVATEASLRAPVVGPIVFVACLAIIIIGLRYSAGPLARWYAQRLKAAEGTKVELAEFSETPPQRRV